MNHAEVLQDRPHLVGLQTADEVPIQVNAIGQFLLLRRGLLQATFTKAALPGLRQRANAAGGVTLAHRKQAGVGGQLCRQGCKTICSRESAQQLDAQGLDEGLVEQLSPAGMHLGTFSAGAIEILLGQMAGIHQGDDLKFDAAALHHDQKKHPLGVEGGVDLPAIARLGDAIEQAKGGVIEIALVAHTPRSANRLSQRTEAPALHQDG